MHTCPICLNQEELYKTNFSQFFHMPICMSCIESIIRIDTKSKKYFDMLDMLRSAEITTEWEKDYHENITFCKNAKLRREKLFKNVKTILYG